MRPNFTITTCYSPKDSAYSAKCNGWTTKKTRDGWLCTSPDGKDQTLFVRR